MSLRLGAALLWLAAAASCTRDVDLFPGVDGGVHGGDGGPTCPGALTSLPSEGASRCAAAVSALTQRYALCACHDLALSSPLSTRSFDSTGVSGGDDSAALGTNGTLTTSAELTIGGALHVGGADARFDASFSTRQSLRVAGDLTIVGDGQVETDAYVDGDVSGKLAVAGILHAPVDASLGAEVTANQIVREPVTVAPPCNCSTAIADVASAIAAIATSNDDAAAGIAPGALHGTSTHELTLPCGRAYLDAIDASSDVRLGVQGHTALAVGGDLSVRGALQVELAPGAELDLYVGGRLAVSGGGVVGNPLAPSRVRIWVAGAGPVVLADHPTLGATLHAPAAPLSAPQGLTLHGSALVDTATFGADSELHYDRATLSSGIACGTPAQTAPM